MFLLSYVLFCKHNILHTISDNCIQLLATAIMLIIHAEVCVRDRALVPKDHQ